MQDETSVHIIYCVVSVLKASEIDFDHVTCERQLNCTFLFLRKTGGKFVSLIFIPSCNAALRNVTQDTKEDKKSSLHFKLVASKFFQEDEASKWFPKCLFTSCRDFFGSARLSAILGTAHILRKVLCL